MWYKRTTLLCAPTMQQGTLLAAPTTLSRLLLSCLLFVPTRLFTRGISGAAHILLQQETLSALVAEKGISPSAQDKGASGTGMVGGGCCTPSTFSSSSSRAGSFMSRFIPGRRKVRTGPPAGGADGEAGGKSER